MSKQGEMAVKELKQLLHERVSVDNIETWVERVRRVDQTYSPNRNVLLRVIALFEPHFDYGNKDEVSRTVKTAKDEMRPIVREIKKANHIK